MSDARYQVTWTLRPIGSAEVVHQNTITIPDPRPEPQPTPRIETDPKPLRVPMFDIGDLTKPLEKKKDKPS